MPFLNNTTNSSPSHWLVHHPALHARTHILRMRSGKWGWILRSLKGQLQVVLLGTQYLFARHFRMPKVVRMGDYPELPSDLKIFKGITMTVSGTVKRNAVIMGRKTWESIPLEHWSLPGHLSAVMTRSGSCHVATAEDVEICWSMASALEQLAASPYCPFIEKVFVIGEWKETCRIYVKQAKLPSNEAAGGETPLSSPERQATTAMPLRISRTPLQLGTISVITGMLASYPLSSYISQL